jgi:hypothetical protein
MTLLHGSFLVVGGKEAGAVKTGEAWRITRLGIVARALKGSAQRRNTTKTQLKITTKIEKRERDKIRRKILTKPNKLYGIQVDVAM